MTQAEMRQLCLARLGEFNTTTPDICALAVVDLELNTAYVYALNLLARNHHFPVIETEVITFDGASKEIDLSTKLTDVPRAIFFAGTVTADSDAIDADPLSFPFRGLPAKSQTYRKPIYGSTSVWSLKRRRLAYLKGQYVLGLYEIPASDLLIRIMSAPVAETIAAGGPDQLPIEFHEYVPTRAAIMLAGGEDSATQLLTLTMARIEESMAAVENSLNHFTPNVPGAWQRYG